MIFTLMVLATVPVVQMAGFTAGGIAAGLFSLYRVTYKQNLSVTGPVYYESIKEICYIPFGRRKCQQLRKIREVQLHVPGSLAATGMSAAAIANGGGVASMAAGGVIATLQSLGATGALAGTTYAGAAMADTLGYALHSSGGR